MKKLNSNNLKRLGHTGRTAGSALITVLGISVILMLAGTAMVVMSRQSIYLIQRTANSAQAQAVAEAGVADMIAKLGVNYTAWQDTSYTPTAPFLTNGAYHVTTQLQTNGHVLIISDGIYKGESNRTIMELFGTVQNQNNVLFGTNSAILADGFITLSSAAYSVDGDIHSNSGVTMHKRDNVNGTVTAVGVVDPMDLSRGDATNVPRRDLPVFNFESYRQMATNGGSYVQGTTNGWTELSGNNLGLSAANGVLYVNGNLSIANKSDFTGTIVVNGNILTANKFDHSPYPGHTNWPSLLSTGSIDLNNHETYNGIIFAKVSININNNITVNGGIISGGITYVKNGVDVNRSNGHPAWDPLNPEVPPEVIVGGWLK